MKVVFLYNPHSNPEVAILEEVRTQMSIILQEVEVLSVSDASNLYPIRDTPALIIIRDDLQGMHLLDNQNNKLRIMSELNKVLEEEDLNLHQVETHRLDNLINTLISNAIDNYTYELIAGGFI